MPVLRPSGSDFTSFVKAAAQYVPPGRSAKVSKSGGVPVALPGLGAIIRTSQVGALASPTTSAVIINGITPLAVVAAAVIRVLLGIVTTLAGSGTPAFADGTGTGASFYYPFGLAVLPDGNIVVADTYNNRIRLITPAGVVTTLAGSNAGYGDGTGTGPTASFFQPQGVAVIPSNNVIVVADTANNRIRRVTYPGGVVTTLAGGNAAFADGTGEGARFSGPHGVAVTSTGVIVVADTDNHRIRLVTQAGVVTTLAGSGSPAFANGTGAAASFNAPRGVAITSTGDIVVADNLNHRIRLVTLAGVVTTLAGSGSPAFADGTGAGASFNYPAGVAITSSGVIVVAEQDNHRIRLVTQAGVVTTLAGSGSGAFADGTGAAASFQYPRGVAVTSTGDVVVADTANNRIRLIA